MDYRRSVAVRKRHLLHPGLRRVTASARTAPSTCSRVSFHSSGSGGLPHFDTLMDSGIMQRVRDIKQRFGTSFYHPRVLATIAEYNMFMGERFDELFREAARSIKQFATSVQQAGASIMARVEGDVTVKQLADVQEDQILGAEYG